MGIIYFLLYLLLAWVTTAVLLWLITRITWSGLILRLTSDGNFKMDALFYTWKGIEILLGSFVILNGINLALRAALLWSGNGLVYILFFVLTLGSFYALVVGLRGWEDARSKLMQVNTIKYNSHYTFVQFIRTSLSIYLLVAILGSIALFWMPMLTFYFDWLPRRLGI
jgi:hypothetical protein